VVQHCTVPRHSRAAVHCRVNCRKILDLEVVKGALEGVQPGKRLNRLDERGGGPGPVCKPFHGAGRITGWFTSGEVSLYTGGGCRASPENGGRGPESTTRDGRGLVPEHLVDLYGDTCDGCESKQGRLVVAQLLSEFKGRTAATGRH